MKRKRKFNSDSLTNSSFSPVQITPERKSKVRVKVRYVEPLKEKTCHLDMFEDANRAVEAQIEMEYEREMNMLAGVSVFDFDAHERKQTDVCLGDERLERIQEILATMKWKRTADQRILHKAILMTVIGLLYQKDFTSNYGRLLALFGRKQFPFATFFNCPRRFGKSIGVAMILSALLYVCDNIRIIIIATDHKTSKALLTMVQRMFMEISGSDGRKLSAKADKLTVTNYTQPSGWAPTAVLQTKKFNEIQALSGTGNSLSLFI